MKRFTKLFLMVSVLPFSVQATVLPIQEDSDSRVSVVRYSPENVINIKVNYGVSTLIQFDKDEYFEVNESNIIKKSDTKPGIGIGDTQAWEINLINNNIFLKPTEIEPNTNLTLVSNKGRTYIFDLKLDKDPFYVVKIQYDKQNDKTDEYITRTPCTDSTNINFSYVKWGDQDISPQYMWDDGRFTCLKFSNNSQLPVAYKVETDGSESIINYNIYKDTMIIHSVSKEYRLRLGDQVLGLKSDNKITNTFNKKSSSVKAVRVVNYE